MSEKEKMLVTSIFSFYYNVFYQIRYQSKHFSSLLYAVYKFFYFVRV